MFQIISRCSWPDGYDDGRVVTWGHNGFGQLGNNSLTNSNVPVFVSNVAGSGQLNDIRTISAGGALTPTLGQPLCGFSYAIDNSGNLYAWGSDNFGQLGDGVSGTGINFPWQVTGISDVISIDAAFTHVTAIAGSNRDIWCWGDNASGQIGNGTNGPANLVSSPFLVPFTGSPSFTSSSAGGYHTVAIDELGNIYSWGRNLAGQLGFDPSIVPLLNEPELVTNDYCVPILPCDVGVDYCIYDYTLPSTLTTWDATGTPGLSCGTGPILIEHHLIIPADASLIISDRTLQFGPEGKIIIERGSGTQKGGSLITSNTIFTNVSDACMWQGIEVHGFSNAPFADVRQGIVELRGSEVHNAHCGIYLGRRINSSGCNNLAGYTGGIQVSDFSNFTNNYVGIQYANGYGNFPIEVIIKDCTFECTSPMIDPKYLGSRSKYFLDINQRINANNSIERNIFRNTPQGTANGTVAIRSNSSSRFYYTDNTFNTVDRGIQFMRSGVQGFGNTVNGANTFNYCGVAIFNLQNQLTTILESTIANGAGSVPIGIWNDRAQSVFMEENLISDQFGGIYMLRSGNNNLNPSFIQKNHIFTSRISLISTGNNFNSTWRCNDLHDYFIGWVIGDINQGGGILDGKIQSQGQCSPAGFPVANEFHEVTSTTIYDIDNQSNTSFNFNYVTSQLPAFPYYIPDIINGLVTVTNCPATIQSEEAYCDGLRTYPREIFVILAERDTTTDTLLINQLNGEILGYYLTLNKIDSAILFVDTFDLEYRDPILLELYYHCGRTDSIRAILGRWVDTSQDGLDLVELHSIFCDLIEDSISINEMSPENLSWIRSISDNDSEAGWMAKGVLNTLYGIPIELPCNLTLSCDESRFANYSDIVNNTRLSSETVIKNYPDPFENETTINLEFDENLVKQLKIHIFDMQGKLMSVSSINSKMILIGKDLPVGLYIYRISGDNFDPISGKMIKFK